MAVSDSRSSSTRLMPALTETSSNYTFIAYRRQYDTDRPLRHHVNVVVLSSSVNNVVMDGRRLTETTTSWTDVCESRGRILSALIPVDTGAHQLYTIDGHAFTGSVLGYTDRSSYFSSLASVNHVDDDDWTAGRLWHPASSVVTRRHTSQTTSVELHFGTARAASEQQSTFTDHREPVTHSREAGDDSSSGVSYRWLATVTVALTTNSPRDYAASAMTTSVTTRYLDSSSLSLTTTSLTAGGVTNAQTRSNINAIALHRTRRPSTTTTSFSDITGSVTSAVPRTTDAVMTSLMRTAESSSRAMTRNVTRRDSAVSVSSTSLTSASESNAPALSLAVNSSLYIITTTSISNHHLNNNSVSVSRRSYGETTTHDAVNRLRHSQTQDDDDDVEQMFATFRTVCIYAGLPIICSLLAAWFFCTQTTLLKRTVKCHPAVANERTMLWSRDHAPAVSDCSVEMSHSVDESSCSLDTLWSPRIAPLNPAYVTARHVGLSLDDRCLLDASDKPQSHDTRSVDVELLCQLAIDCHRQTGVDKFACCSGGPTSDRLYVETPPCESQPRLKHLVSLPHRLI